MLPRIDAAMRAWQEQNGTSLFPMSGTARGKTATRKFVQPYGINVSSSSGSVVASMLRGTGAAALASSPQPGIRTPDTRATTGAFCGAKGGFPTACVVKVILFSTFWGSNARA